MQPPPPPSPSQWPIDTKWLDELETLLPVETVTPSAPFEATAQIPAPTVAPVAAPQAVVSKDSDKQLSLVPKVRDRRRVHSQKKRDELLSLRELSAELEAQLNELLRRRKALATNANGSKRLIAGWRGVALRQLQRRIDAEALNRELRIHIRSRHEASVSLLEALRAQMAAMRAMKAVNLADEEQKKPVMLLNEKDVWDMSLLMQDIDDMCAQAPVEIQRANLPQLEDAEMYSSRYSRDVSEDAGVRTATFAENIVMPIPITEAIPALDKAFPTMFTSECVPAISEITDDGSAVAVKFVWGQFEVLSIYKSTEDTMNSAFAWRSVIRDRGQASNSSFAEYGWGNIVPADELASSTRIQLLSFWRADERNDECKPALQPLDRYSQMLVESSERDAGELSQTLENLIVDEAVERKQSTNKSE